MKLRPRGSRSSITGVENSPVEAPVVAEDGGSSDEENRDSASSDSEYIASSDERDVYTAKALKDRSEDLDLNVKPEPGLVPSDDDLVDEVPKRRKRRRGKESVKVEEELVNEEELANKVEEEEEGNNVKIDTPAESSKKKKNKRKRKDEPILMWEVWEEENAKWIEDNLEKEIDFENQNDVIPETVEAPSDLIMPLLRYQKEWLAWALKQEESSSRGGILADEMGMGKTVQAIALVCAKRELKEAICEPSLLSPAPSTSTELPAIKATLVICPVVAVNQWVSEIDRFTAKGSNKVLVYHGANRGRKCHQFSEYDFVITTYSIVEAEYRKNVLPPKEKCQWCGKLLLKESMATHLQYFCGPAASRTEKQSKQHRKLGLQLTKPDPSRTKGQPSDLEDDTKKRGRKKGKKSYKDDPVENEVGAGDASTSKKSIMHSFKWERIILDEAHYIKDRRSNTTRAVLALVSSYKWALSGTPLQNRVGELYSLVRFLQMVPYSYYFCKDCDCRTLDYSSTADCSTCPHRSVRHFCWWNKYIATPIQTEGTTGAGRGAMLLLKHKMLKSIVLRRTKKGRAADLALPPRIVSLRRDSFDITEEDYYTSLYNETQAEFNTYVQSGTLMNNYAHIFDLLTRLRQAVDHPYLVVYSNSALAKKAEASTGDQVCGICHDLVEDPVVSSCAHVFCKSCLIDFSVSVGQVLCPSCSKPLTVDLNASNDTGEQSNKTTIKGFRPSSILNRLQLDDFQTSTKIEALREEIRFMTENDGSAKGIVFSQFTSFLDLIHYSLQKSGVKCVQLVGSMSMGARDTAIKKFSEDPDCKIFLMSLKAGGVALNLTVASHVFLMDPWWNPAVERQAQDRIHRIGQYKPIKTVRFVIENTVEERILKLQEKKELVFEGTVGGSSEALGKLTEADLRFLFHI